jgi:hypothetical protein
MRVSMRTFTFAVLIAGLPGLIVAQTDKEKKPR